jgi:hypothetical protein
MRAPLGSIAVLTLFVGSAAAAQPPTSAVHDGPSHASHATYESDDAHVVAC